VSLRHVDGRSRVVVEGGRREGALESSSRPSIPGRPARLHIRLTLPYGTGFTLQLWRGAGC
jgi:hypothetical protein